MIQEKKEVIFILLDRFADWEGAFIASSLHQGVKRGSKPKYSVKTLSLTKTPIRSIGGFNILPDYDINTIPPNNAGLILVGGMSWFTPEAQLIVPFVEKAISNNRLVAGICNASIFLGINGFLNQVKHTSNTLEYLKMQAGDKYIGEANYVTQQCVRDGNIITANGTAYLEFCREILYALDVDTPTNIEDNYLFNKNGLYNS